MNFIRFSVLSAALCILDWCPAVAQISTTEPVGFHTLTINPGLRTVGLPLVRTEVGRGAVASSSPSVITTSATTTNFGQLLNAANAYYLEITDGTQAARIGERYEIDVAATINSGNHTLTVATTSPHNTSPLVLADLSGAKFVIRPHLTLGFVFGIKGSTPMAGATVPTQSDQLIFWCPALNDGSGGYETYFLYRSPLGDVEEWRKADGGNANYDHRIIPPGEGFLINRYGGTQVSIVVTGAVRMTPSFVQNLEQGLNLVSGGYPTNASPVERGYTVAQGWTGAKTATNADQVEVWNAGGNGGTGGFEPYFLLQAGNVEQWRKAGGGLTDFATTRIFQNDEAYFVRKVTAQPNATTSGALVGNASVRYDFSSPFLESGKTSTGNILDETFTFHLGVFAAGFTPTAGNRSDWEENFSSLGNTTWTQEGGATGEFYGSATLFGNSGPFQEGAQLYLWGFNNASLSATTEWVLLTNPSSANWRVIRDPGGLNQRRLDISDAGTTAVFGSLGSTGENPYVQTAVANVPSTPVPALPPGAFAGMAFALFAYVAFGPARQQLGPRSTARRH